MLFGDLFSFLQRGGARRRGACKLANYRVYSLRSDGGIQHAQNIESDDDRQALRFAEGLLNEYPSVEVWQAARLVKRIDRPHAPSP